MWAAISAFLAGFLKWLSSNGNTVSGMAVGAAAATTKAKLDDARKDARQTDAAIARREANAGLSNPAAAHELYATYKRRKQRRNVH